MPVRLTNASFFRQGSGRLLLCGALLCAALFTAHLPVMATIVALLIVAMAGALRRFQEQKSETASRPLARTPPAVQGDRPARGIASRRSLERKLQEEGARDKRPGDPTALLLISVDAFSQLQGPGGQQGTQRPGVQQQGVSEPGNNVAAEVAMLTLSCALQRMLPREADMLARYDDSTFAVVLSGTDLPGSLRVAARLRWAVVRLGIANPGTASGFLTVSMGIAVKHGLNSHEGEALLLDAESVLDAARRTGDDSLKYILLCGESSAGSTDSQLSSPAPPASRALPAIRAWTPEPASVLYSPQR